MRKILLFLFLLILLFGCKEQESPKNIVENYFIGYQKLDEQAIKNIDFLVSTEESLNIEQKIKYKEILKRHFEKLKYKIKKQKIIKNKAYVISEIVVKNNLKVLKTSEYKKNNFINSNGNFLINSFNDYKIKLLKEEKTNIKYKIKFSLHKKNKKWLLNNITKKNQQKMLGIYEKI